MKNINYEQKNNEKIDTRKKKTYCIIETSGSPHEDGLQSLVETLKVFDYRVILCLSKENADRAEKLEINKSVDQILVCENWKILFGPIELFKKTDALIMHTISVRNTLPLFLITLLCKTPFVIFIRNINSWYRFTWHKSSIRNLIARNISTMLKKIMLRRCASIIVENERLKATLLEHGEENVDVVPFKIIKCKRVKYECEQEKIFNLIVPGVIDFKKKDLETILTAFAQLSKDEAKLIRIIFLGRVKTSEDNLICLRYKKIFGDSFLYFTNFIEPYQFEKFMDEADLVIGSYFPLHICEHFRKHTGALRVLR